MIAGCKELDTDKKRVANKIHCFKVQFAAREAGKEKKGIKARLVLPVVPTDREDIAGRVSVFCFFS